MEIPVDEPRIDSLLNRAFNRESEAALVRTLREDGLLTLGVVATDDEGGEVSWPAPFAHPRVKNGPLIRGRAVFGTRWPPAPARAHH